MTSRKPDLTTLPGALGDRYEVVRELGRGGTSSVYLAHDRTGERDVAIKVIRSSHADDAEAVARLQREARILERLKHPCIVRLLDTHALDDGRLGLVIEYVPGRTLKQVIREGGPLSLKHVESVLLDITAALVHANEHAVVHRDVKPENIVIDEDGRARLSDFGIARMGRAAAGITMTGSTIGTPAYMSPEQIDGAAVDGRSDLYSLGMTAFEMLTGRMPWAGDNLYTVIYRQKHDELPSVRDLRPDTPPHLMRAVSGLTRKHPVARWNTAAEFRAQLERSIAEAEQTGAPLAPAGRPAPSMVTEDSPTLRFMRPGQPGADRPERATGAGAGVPAAGSADAVAVIAAMGATAATGATAGSAGRAGSATASSGAAGPASAAKAIVHQDESEVLSARRRVSRTGPRKAHRATRRRRTVLAAIALVVVASGATLAMIVDRNGSIDEDMPTPDVPLATGSGTATSAEFPVAPPPGTVAIDTALERAGGGMPEPSSQPARITIARGDGQTAIAGDVLAAPVAIRVEDADGEPVANARVTFRVAAGGGNVAPAEALTDSRGVVAAAWSMGTTAGPNELAAAVRGAPQATVRIGATGLTGPAARIVVAEGEDGAARGPSRRVRFVVQDRHGNPVSGAQVDVQVAAGGGAVEPASVSTPVTGEAVTTWMLGSDTANRIVAALRGTDIRIEYSPPPLRLGVRPDIAAGGTHSCTLAASGAAFCWGGNERGQLGSGRTTRQDGLVRVLASGPIARMAAGISHSCVLEASGGAACWGLNTSGQLGTGDQSERPAPTAVSGASRYVNIAAGLAHTCAIAEGGSALCWGEGGDGQIGHGATVDRTAPTGVAGGHTFSTLSAGWRHTCALTPQNAAWCWGANGSGQLGDGSASTRAAPARVAGGHRFRSISAGASHTCGVTTEGVAYCWGGNDHGQTGRSGSGSSEPAAVTAPAAFAGVTSGAVHTCALTRAGEALCWGRNNFGQLGNESTADSSEPVRVAGELRFASLSASGSHTCGRTTSGQDYCWGYNVEGQIGDGTRTNRSRPVRVGSSQ